jgi:hypothetical protein
VVSISACHAGDPGSIPGVGETLFFMVKHFYAPLPPTPPPVPSLQLLELPWAALLVFRSKEIEAACMHAYGGHHVQCTDGYTRSKLPAIALAKATARSTRQSSLFATCPGRGQNKSLSHTHLCMCSKMARARVARSGCGPLVHSILAVNGLL